MSKKPIRSRCFMKGKKNIAQRRFLRIRIRILKTDFKMSIFAEITLAGIPGVKPINQDRSHQAVIKFIEVSESLMRGRKFEDIAVEDFAAAAGLSVGAFYSRFEHKDAFFEAIKAVRMMDYVETARTIVPFLVSEESTLSECIREIVSVVVEFTRANRGLIASSVRRSTDFGSWMPHRSAARNSIDIIRVVLPKIPIEDPELRDLRYLYGFQVIYGLVTNATLNDPGPIMLNDERFIEMASSLLESFWT